MIQRQNECNFKLINRFCAHIIMFILIMFRLCDKHYTNLCKATNVLYNIVNGTHSNWQNPSDVISFNFINLNYKRHTVAPSIYSIYVYVYVILFAMFLLTIDYVWLFSSHTRYLMHEFNRFRLQWDINIFFIWKSQSE